MSRETVSPDISTQQTELSAKKEKVSAALKSVIARKNYDWEVDTKSHFENSIFSLLNAAGLMHNYDWSELNGERLIDELEEIANNSGHKIGIASKTRDKTLFSPLIRSMKNLGVNLSGREPRYVFLETVNEIKSGRTTPDFDSEKNPSHNVFRRPINLTLTREQKEALREEAAQPNTPYYPQSPNRHK